MDSGGNVQRVSIHALLAECDLYDTIVSYSASSFNPRTPCGVRPSSEEHLRTWSRVSIHALLAECDGFAVLYGSCDHSFNPRTPCGVRLRYLGRLVDSPRFQSTHSLRSATCWNLWSLKYRTVSIHALLAECDQDFHKIWCWLYRFNPRTPCGVRRNRLYTLLLNRANHTLRQPP